MSVIAVFTIGRATREGDFSNTVENDSVVSETLKNFWEVGFSSILRSWLKHFESDSTSAVASLQKACIKSMNKLIAVVLEGYDSYFGTSLVLCSEAQKLEHRIRC